MERTHVRINALVDRIDRGEIKLPEIQRAYVWKPAQVAHLIDSLYRGYPSGSMLLWRAPDVVGERPAAIDGPNQAPVGQAQYLLDGQQRLTSLHRVYKRHPAAEVVFNVESQRFQVQSAATRRDARWVVVADVLNATKLSQLRKTIVEAHADLDEDDVDDRLQRLRALGEYEYYLEILTDLPYRQVAEIFVRVNSKGRALKTVDLTLAILSAEWPGVVGKIDDQVELWANRGWSKIDATFLVRALAATATDGAVLSQLPTTPIDRLEAGWEQVKYGLEHLIKILAENAGIQTSTLIPSMNALVPLVALLGRRRGQELKEADALLYWLFGVFVTARYSAAADTKIAQDALAIRSGDPVRELYKNAGLLGVPLSISAEQLVGKGAGSPFFLLSYLAAKRRHAKDWWHDVEISEDGAGSAFPIEYHHVHPQKTLRDRYSKGEINDLANLVFISATANKKISDRSPESYFPELGSDGGGRPDELSPHLVPADPALRRAEAYRDFLVARRQLLAAAMTELVSSLRPDWVVGAPSADGGEEIERAVSVTLYAGPQGRLLFEAARGDDRYVASVGHAELERFLRDAADGVAGDLDIGSGQASYEPEQDDLTLPVGPFEITGSIGDWRAMIMRELRGRASGRRPAGRRRDATVRGLARAVPGQRHRLRPTSSISRCPSRARDRRRRRRPA